MQQKPEIFAGEHWMVQARPLEETRNTGHNAPEGVLAEIGSVLGAALAAAGLINLALAAMKIS